MSEAKFVALQKEVFQLFHEGRMDEVHALIDNAQHTFPERMDKTLFWKACAFAVQEKSDQAIDVLHNGIIRKGIWWNPLILTSDPDLNSLQNIEEFQMIVKECEETFENHKQEASSELFTYGNHRADIGIFPLHMRGSNAKDFAPHWLDDNTATDFYFGFPQSSQVFGFNAFCWDDEKAMEEEINKTYMEFKKQGSTKQDILAGASQGGKLAIEMCLGQKVDVEGFIAIIPAIRDLSEIESLLKAIEHTTIKGSIITGDQDPYYEKTIQLVELFEQYNIPCKLTVVEGLGHFIPGNLRELLPEEVNFVLYSD